MKIGIDLDGVVFNTEMLWATYAEIYDCKELKRNSIIEKDEPRVQEKYNWTSDEMKIYFNKYVNIKDFDIVPGAKEVINLLKNENELIVITARGTIGDLEDEICIAQEKLNEKYIEFDKYYWNQKEKLDVCKKENIDIMIDDNYLVCENLAKSGISSIYFRCLGRKKVTHPLIKEVTNWGEIYRYIKEIN